jgi:quercetin dioxygenase-like cupin family protein
VIGMPLDVRSVPRPDWAPLPRDGCRGVEVKVLLEDDHLLVAMLRFRPDATIDEHPSGFDGDVICLEGRGMTSVGTEQASLHAGQRVHWPAEVPHRLWTGDSEMVTLMIEHQRGAHG